MSRGAGRIGGASGLAASGPSSCSASACRWSCSTILLVWGLMLTARLDRPAPDGALKVRVIGEMWWFRVQYLDPSGRVIAEDANELHLPAGRPVAVELQSADVIHSFWVPHLSGKKDMIPGRTNTMTIQADRARPIWRRLRRILRSRACHDGHRRGRSFAARLGGVVARPADAAACLRLRPGIRRLRRCRLRGLPRGRRHRGGRPGRSQSHAGRRPAHPRRRDPAQ